jgi:predicted nucleic acid-binding protein
MRILLDTNILTRLIEPGHAMHRDALDATRTLGTQGHTLCIVPQNLFEFWVVCTRPTANNGLGKTAAEAAAELSGLKSLFTSSTTRRLCSWPGNNSSPRMRYSVRTPTTRGLSRRCSFTASLTSSRSTTRTSVGIVGSQS